MSPVWHAALSGPSQHFLVGVISTFFLPSYTNVKVCVTCITSLAHGSLGTIITFSGRGCLKIILTFLFRCESMSHVSPVWHLTLWGPSQHFLDGVVSTIFLTIIFRRESMCLTCHYSGTWLSGAVTTFSGQCLYFLTFLYRRERMCHTFTSLALCSLGTVTTFSGRGCLDIFLPSYKDMSVCVRRYQSGMWLSGGNETTFFGQGLSTFFLPSNTDMKVRVT